MPEAESRIVYADSSALVKRVIEEAESEALSRHLATNDHVLATSRIALVEVTRATAIANPEFTREAERLLASCLLIDVTDGLLRAVARLTSLEVRTLDAIHVASAQRVDADEFISYDARQLDAARRSGLSVSHPGVTNR